MGQPTESRHCLRDEEDPLNLKQLLRYIKGTIHYRVNLEPKVEHNEKGQKVSADPVQTQIGLDAIQPGRVQVAQSQCAGECLSCTSAGLNPQLLWAQQNRNYMQWVKLPLRTSTSINQVIGEMAIPEMDTDNVTMMIKTDSSSGKAVASQLGLNRKSNTFNYVS
eukprot:5185703-Amphidinium_carterae.1